MANILTSAGKAIMTARMLGATPSQVEPKFISWGTGAGTAAIADVALFTESVEARTTGTGAQFTTSTITNDAHQVSGTITATAGRVITNAGVFDTSGLGTGNLYLHGDFAGVTLATGESIAFIFRNQLT